MNPSIKLVVFDMAGTTIRDCGEIAQSFLSAIEGYGYTMPLQEVNKVMGYEKREAIRMMLVEQEENGDKINKKFIDKIYDTFLEQMIAYYKNNDIEALDHVEYLFRELKKQGIKIALNTGFPKEIATIIVQGSAWMDKGLIDAFISSSDVPAGRPAPYMIETLMQQTGVTNAKNVVKVGDTEVDIMEGRNASCLLSIGVTTGAFSRAMLEPYQPDFIIDDLLELVGIVDQYNPRYVVK